MNADNFAQYLEDPSLLYQASYQELKSLSLQYPYCQNLHLLLFQKSYMEGSREWEQNLEKAAVYSIDRKHLYHQAKKLDRKEGEGDNFLLSEEFLELKSLESLEMEEPLLRDNGKADWEEAGLKLEFTPMPQEPPGKEKNTLEEFLPIELEEEEETDEPFEISAGLAPREDHGQNRAEGAEEEPGISLAESASDALPARPAEPAEPGKKFEVTEELILDCSALLFLLETSATESSPPDSAETGQKNKEKGAGARQKENRRPPLPSPDLDALKLKARSRPIFTVDMPAEGPVDTPRPQPKQSFTSWVEKFQSPTVQVRLSELMESKKREDSRKKRKNKKKDKPSNPPGVGRLAIKSITENKEILSETLAELLASQGKNSRAIEMYKALMLVFPQKSDFFAEKIENLKSK